MTAVHERVPPDGSGEPATLEFLMEDCVAHLLHHPRQVPGRGWRASAQPADVDNGGDS